MTNRPTLLTKEIGHEKINSATKVAYNSRKCLQAVTVMFKHEKNYDAGNKDWFWVKFVSDDSIMKKPKGMFLAGRVAKGKKKGCIACHRGSPGGDMVYLHDRY